MTEYSNSPKGAKQDPNQEVAVEKKIDKVISGEVIQKKPTLGHKFKEVFFGGDFKGTMRYLAGDILLPAFRNIIVDATTKGIERAVYGERVPYRNSSSNAYTPRVQYNRINNPLMPSDPRGNVYMPGQDPRPALNANRKMNDIILASKPDAEYVVEQMYTIIDQWESVSLADLMQLLGLPSAHTDNKWGWTTLGRITIQQVKEGYLINLPPLEALE